MIDERVLLNERVLASGEDLARHLCSQGITFEDIAPMAGRVLADMALREGVPMERIEALRTAGLELLKMLMDHDRAMA